MLYQVYQDHCDLMEPVRVLAGMVAGSGGPGLGRLADHSLVRNLTAAYEIISRAGLTHERPPFDIHSVTVGNREVKVTEEPVLVTPFGTLLHFKKDVQASQPRVVLVAPLSGHFATLLRATVATMLPEHDVHHGLAQRAPRRAAARPLRLRRLHRAPDPLPRSRWLSGSRDRGVPALCRRARRLRRDGTGQQPGPAAQPDADGRPDRLARQSHAGQRTSAEPADRVGRAESFGQRAAALSGRSEERREGSG